MQYAHTRTDAMEAATLTGMNPASIGFGQALARQVRRPGHAAGRGGPPSTTMAVPRKWNSVVPVSARLVTRSTTPITPCAPNAVASSSMRV